jgi:hypothetical protein
MLTWKTYRSTDGKDTVNIMISLEGRLLAIKSKLYIADAIKLENKLKDYIERPWAYPTLLDELKVNPILSEQKPIPIIKEKARSTYTTPIHYESHYVKVTATPSISPYFIENTVTIQKEQDMSDDCFGFGPIRVTQNIDTDQDINDYYDDYIY